MQAVSQVQRAQGAARRRQARRETSAPPAKGLLKGALSTVGYMDGVAGSGGADAECGCAAGLEGGRDVPARHMTAVKKLPRQ